MAMAIGSPDGEEDAVIASINTTPLVDVMLVLLIIFLITSPVVIKTIPIKLPAEHNQPYKTKPENITLAIDKEGDMYWNQTAVPNTDVLLDKLKKIAVMVPQPEVHIRGDQQTRYEFIGKAILTAQRAGIAKVSFIMEPPPRGG
jgi:biopolymer transport protein ExbD